MQAGLAITLLGLHGGRYLEAVAAVPARRQTQQVVEMCAASGLLVSKEQGVIAQQRLCIGI